MAKFKTLDGKTWVIDVTYLTVKRVRDLCSVNLLDICNLDKESLSGWVADDLRVLEVVCAVVRPQLAALDMSDEDFFAACDGGTLKSFIHVLGRDGAIVGPASPRPAAGTLLRIAAEAAEGSGPHRPVWP
jgi:hypothetical protein